MEISPNVEMALTTKRAQTTQAMSIAMMKQALVQDASVLQVVASASHSTAPIMPSHSGLGHNLDILV